MENIQELSRKEPLVIQYTNILHEYGVGSSEALNFREQYREDKTFQRRAEVLEILINNKNILKKRL